MKKTKKNDELIPKSVYPINTNLMNIISPSAVDFNDRQTQLGENVGKIYAISKYPDTNDYGWLAPLCNLEGTATTIEFHYTDSGSLIEAYNKMIAELKGTIGGLKDESDRQLTKEKIKDLEKLIRRLAVQQEPVGYVNVMLHIQDINEKKLTERIKRVSNNVAVEGCNLKLLTKRQGMALSVIAPYGIPEQDVSNMGLRNMPISSFIGGFPMANPGLNDSGGYYLGKTNNGKGRTVIVNPWLRGKDRTNSNWSITGVPGTGKSTALKDILTMEYGLGTRIIMFDPNNEFMDLTEHPDINGDVIYCAGERPEKGRKSARINPLQARRIAIVTEEDLEPGESIEEFLTFDESENDDISDLATYIQFLRKFFRRYFGKEEFDASIQAALEECLIDTYAKFNIDWKADIDSIPAEKWPIMTDLYETTIEKRKQENLSEYEKNKFDRLKDLLFKAGRGADRLWNGPTTLETNADFVDLVVSGLEETDENVKGAQYFNILTWANHEATKNREERVLVAVDEGYLTIDPEYPEIAKYMRNMSKQFRKFEAGFMFITHAVSDLLEPEIKRYGQAIIDNACYKLILGCDGKNLQETADLLDLTEKEINILSQKNRGQGIFFAGNVRMDLTVDVSDEILAMMGMQEADNMEAITAVKAAATVGKNKEFFGKIILTIALVITVPFLLLVCCFTKLISAFTPDGMVTSAAEYDVTKTEVYKSVKIATKPFYDSLWEEMTKKKDKIVEENTVDGEHYETINGINQAVSDRRQMAIVTRKLNYLGDAYFVAYLTCKNKMDFKTGAISTDTATAFYQGICKITVTENDYKKFVVTNEFLSVDEIAQKYFSKDTERQEFKASCYAYSQFFDVGTYKIETDVGDWRSPTEASEPEAGNFLQIPLYLQYSSKWANVPYGNGTIKAKGCCPTCLAMVLSYLKQQVILPSDVVSWAGNKYYVNGQGTSWSIFGAVNEKWGVKCTNISKNQKLMVQALRENKPVIASMGPGEFTKGGHFIVLSGITKDGKIKVKDPNDNNIKNHEGAEFEISMILRESKNFGYVRCHNEK